MTHAQQLWHMAAIRRMVASLCLDQARRAHKAGDGCVVRLCMMAARQAASEALTDTAMARYYEAHGPLLGYGVSMGYTVRK